MQSVAHRETSATDDASLRVVSYRWIHLQLPLALALWMGAAGAQSAETAEAPGSAEAPRGHIADRMRDSVDTAVQSTVHRIDSFFVDSEHSTFEDRKTRVRLRLNTDYLENHGWDVSPNLKLHLVLPGLNERLRLVINDDQSPDGDQAAQNDDDNDVALRWIGKQSNALGYSFDLGLRIKSGTPDPFARVNLGTQYDMGPQWAGQTTNRIYYYAKTGWRNDLRQYFNRGLTDDLLLRFRTRLQYFHENDYNPFFEQKVSLFHSLSDTRKLAYEVLYRREAEEDSPFDEDEILGSPGKSYVHYLARVRYRQQLWRPWFYVEAWPTIAWPEERNYDTTLGIRFRLEVNFGGTGDQRLDE